MNQIHRVREPGQHSAHEPRSVRTCPDTRPSATAPIDEKEARDSIRHELVQRFVDLPDAIVAGVVDHRFAAHAAATNRFYVPALVHGEAVRELLRLRRDGTYTIEALTTD